MNLSIENKLKVIQEQVANCTKCDLHKTRKQTVFARGNPLAKIVIISEAPGSDEDDQGLPFVGRAGQLLDSVIHDLGYNSNIDFYVINIIKCRPPNNRKPSDEEVNHCIGYLEEQLKLVDPKIIIALGNTAINGITPTTYGVSKLRGTYLKYKHIPVMCTWHPSFILRNGKTGQVYIDFKNDLQAAILESKKST
jgi:uracil-DNA glycosylase